MTLSFTVTLTTKKDWDEDLGGWRCSVFSIPGAYVESIFVEGEQLDPARYTIRQNISVIRWNQNNRNRPDKIAVLISIDDSKLSTRELTLRWKKIATIATPIGLILAAIISALVTWRISIQRFNEEQIVPSPTKQSILDKVRDREDVIEGKSIKGQLKCGIDGSFQGFSSIGHKDTNGNIKDITGFDADYCRVIAAAIFGKDIVQNNDPKQWREKLDEKIKFIEVPIGKRFEYVKDEKIDVLFRNTSWTAGRDLQPKIKFGSPIFYDQQQILVKSNSEIKELKDLRNLINSEKKLCVLDGTTSQANIIRYLKDNDILKDNESIDSILKEQIHDNKNSFFDSFEQNNSPCNAITADLSQIITNFYGILTKKDSSYYFVNLKKSISQELLSPVFIEGDSQWENIINYSIYATIRATELGISKDKVDKHVKNTNLFYEDQPLPQGQKPLSLEGKQLLGIDDNNINKYIGQDIGLDKEFAQNVIKLVGNYYDIFNQNLSLNFKEYYPERTITKSSNTLCLYIEDEERLKGDKNQLWTCGGILISPPFTYDEESNTE